jgi:membrane protease YdiL (CAAX protease family)
VKEAGKIFAYLVGVLFLGALLAPPLYWGVQILVEAGVLVVLRKFAFQKYFNRGVLLAAVALLWPLVRWLGIRNWRPPAFRRDALWKGRLWSGFWIGAGAMGLLGGVLWAAGVYGFQRVPEGGAVLSVAGSAVAVSLLEEALFRGALTGLLLRGMGAAAALWWTSGLFALVHFLKPDPAVKVAEVGWFSGFELLPHSFHQFAKPLLFLGGFGTLLTLGLVLGLALQRTGSLWMGIGFHAGLVLVKGVFLKSFGLVSEFQPWAGPEIQVGLAPVCALLLGGCAVWWRSRPGAAPAL